MTGRMVVVRVDGGQICGSFAACLKAVWGEAVQ